MRLQQVDINRWVGRVHSLNGGTHWAFGPSRDSVRLTLINMVGKV